MSRPDGNTKDGSIPLGIENDTSAEKCTGEFMNRLNYLFANALAYELLDIF